MKSNRSYTIDIEPLEKKGSIYKLVSDRDVMTYSKDMIGIKCHKRWPDNWNAYLIFYKPKLIWCNVDFDNVLSGLWNKLIIKVHWMTCVFMVQFSIAVS